jgi:tetratricopeptide (TPR) repeat protein
MRAFSLLLLATLAFSSPLLADEKKWAELDAATLTEANSGQLEKARQLGEEALALARKEFGKDDPRTASSLALLGEILLGLQQLPEAETKLREAMAIRERTLKPGHTDLEQSYNLLGRALSMQGQFAAAEKLHLKALAAAEKAAKAGEIGPQAPRWTDLVGSLNQLAIFYSRNDNKAKASAMRKRAIDALALYASKDKHDHLLRLETLAQWAVDDGDHADADFISAAHLRASESYFGAAGTTQSLRTFGAIWALSGELARA